MRLERVRRLGVVSISGKLVQVVCKGDFVCSHLTRLELCFEKDQKCLLDTRCTLESFQYRC